VEIAEIFSTESGGAAKDSGDLDVGAGFDVCHRGPVGAGEGNYFFVVKS
jgi:hypothetical protein